MKLALKHQFNGFTLDLSLEAGTGVTALFGHSGAGKSTVINAVAGLLHPDSGYLEVDGQVLMDTKSGLHVPAHKRRFGTVFQDARLFPHLDVSQNLDFGTRYAPKGTKVNRDEVIDLLGLASLLSRAPNTLSGGEKQRVALGRALLSGPRMLLMDEPLASLDSARKQEILPYLEHLRDGPLGLPILYVSHALEEITRLADTLALIKGGKIAAQGSLTEVMGDPAVVPLLGVREAGAVIEATVLSHANDGLSQLAISGGTLDLPGVKASVGTRVRLRILAQDIMLSRTRPTDLSALNILPVTVQDIRMGDGPGAAVSLLAGEDRLLARVTRRAVSALNLTKGAEIFAVLKATTVAPSSIGR
ncbi:molybdenum ABC transporter ATP-binding protein [Sulfitobacter donghicola]|uniref:Molybdenum ABC transporter ATP-binding protein n=1 Tax=Sulfitobacter donghicola DSW-25 = KCTC 12864 = JCM 14565 TaxID=1300350 RepID=A0A073ISB1_9RHOB|nr:molybdenum ABC transporter ATP-binding protein [Sulfitobacter donghicola]KEJ88287.1 molybdenum ABC transporter ATP-binding protein [Sulfitobacter donghicola DSW-25 = KCTC 12864 = JCM 14565]KIN68882.1 Molybdate ABC transporter, ATP-binding protein [Sulfitobacter donghicola DSW-25 = KCTC 12864 = JCM 14565]